VQSELFALLLLVPLLPPVQLVRDLLDLLPFECQLSLLLPTFDPAGGVGEVGGVGLTCWACAWGAVGEAVTLLGVEGVTC
jgi:hypothetical protein